MARNWGFSPVKDPAFFASYNSPDWKKAAAVAKELYDMGYPVWYDAGLEAGTKKWNAQISANIEQSYALLIFITKGLFERKESYVTIEYEEAKALGKVIIPVFMDEVELKNVDPQYRSYLIEWRKLHGVNGVGKDIKEIAEQLVSVIEEDDRIEYVKLSDANVLSNKNQKLSEDIRNNIFKETAMDAVFLLFFVLLFLYSAMMSLGYDLFLSLPEMLLFITALMNNISILKKEKSDSRIMYARKNHIHYLFRSNRIFASFPYIFAILYQINNFIFIGSYSDWWFDRSFVLPGGIAICMILVCLIYPVLHCFVWSKRKFSNFMEKLVSTCGLLSNIIVGVVIIGASIPYIAEWNGNSILSIILSILLLCHCPLLFMTYMSQVGIISKIRQFD